MLKELMTKTLAVFFLSCTVFTAANALDVSAFKKETDGEATVTLCKTLQIKNVSLKNDTVTQTVVLPKDEGEYENLSLLNDSIASKIVTCFEGVCDFRTIHCTKPPYTLISKRKVEDKDLVVAKVAFDKDLSVTFLVSSYKKKNKTVYRVRTPQDLKFLKSWYYGSFRNWLIKETKDLL